MGKLPDKLRKALLNSRGQMKATRVNRAFDYAKENDMKITKKQIKDYIKEIEDFSEEKVDFGKMNKQFVFNYLGGFFADIGFNRNATAGIAVDGERQVDKRGKVINQGWLKEFVVLVHGNSGYARAYQINNKTRAQVSVVVNSFIQEMERKFKYPVKRIVTDNDQCFKDQNIPYVNVTAEIHENNDIDGEEIYHKNHRLFSRIDSFMSHLRRYAWNQYQKDRNARIALQKVNEKKELYIPWDTVNQFIWEWNQHIIPVIRCSREEMLKDQDLEKAYICMALYANEGKDKFVHERLANNMEVRLTGENNVFGNRQMKAHNERPGTYTITRTMNNQYVGVNTQNPADVVYFHPNEVNSIVHRGKYEEEMNELADVEDPLNAPNNWENQIIDFEDPVHNNNKGIEVWRDNNKQQRKEKKKQKAREYLEEEEDKDEQARILAYEAIMREFDRGLFPDFRPDQILKLKEKMKNKLIELERDGMFHIGISESRNRKNKPLETRAKARMREHLIEQAKNDPILRQDVVVSKTEELAHLVKKNKLRKRR